MNVTELLKKKVEKHCVIQFLLTLISNGVLLIDEIT